MLRVRRTLRRRVAEHGGPRLRACAPFADAIEADFVDGDEPDAPEGRWLSKPTADGVTVTVTSLF